MSEQNGIAVEQCPMSRSGAFALGIVGKPLETVSSVCRQLAKGVGETTIY